MAAEREARGAAETRLEEMNKQLEAQHGLLEEARGQLSDSFKALSSDGFAGEQPDVRGPGEADAGAAARRVEAV